jgi:hypothetical protein
MLDVIVFVHFIILDNLLLKYPASQNKTPNIVTAERLSASIGIHNGATLNDAAIKKNIIVIFSPYKLYRFR